MVASGWKSFLLKAVDPFFTKDGKGAQIPVTLQGTKSEPKFGLDLKHLHGDERDGSNGKSGLQRAQSSKTTQLSSPPKTTPPSQ
jgi:hypothetical protein